MHLNIKNIGKVDSADIELNGITVIAGLNNTGKSTVGKALYSLCNGLCDIDRKIYSEKMKRIIREVRDFLSLCGVPETVLIEERDIFCEAFGGCSFDEIPYTSVKRNNSSAYSSGSSNASGLSDSSNASELTDSSNVSDSSSDSAGSERMEMIHSMNMDPEKITKGVSEFVEKCLQKNGIETDEGAAERLFARIFDICEIPDEELEMIILTRYFRMEFNGQINPVSTGNDGDVSLSTGPGNKRVIYAAFSRDRCSELFRGFNVYRNAIYLDTPLILGCRRTDRFLGMTMHQADAADLLLKSPDAPLDGVLDEAIGRRKLSGIFEKINETIPGKFVRDPAVGDAYLEDGAKKPIALANLSSGLKMLAIIRKLTENGSITADTILVLDEPEIHLHPEWQIVLAEIIVLFRKEMRIKILFNTHSPYFLSAVETYSRKYGIEDECNYYRIESRGPNHSVIVNADDDPESIYRELAIPFQKLEDIRYEDDVDMPLWETVRSGK